MALNEQAETHPLAEQMGEEWRRLVAETSVRHAWTAREER